MPRAFPVSERVGHCLENDSNYQYETFYDSDKKIPGKGTRRPDSDIMMMATPSDNVSSSSPMVSRDSYPWGIQLMHTSAALIPARWLATDNDWLKQTARVTDSDRAIMC